MKFYLSSYEIGDYGEVEFFEIFIQKITSNTYNINDKLRRLEYIKDLPKIFSKISPSYSRGRYIFVARKFQVIVKESKSNKLQMLTIYPLYYFSAPSARLDFSRGSLGKGYAEDFIGKP